jgi:ligand-binding SRPBCC domain-containing protein
MEWRGQCNADVARSFTVQDQIVVHAPIKRCFLLSTNIEIVEQELKMRPVRGRITGFVTGNDSIRWEGWQLGLPQFHESIIELFQPPLFFRDRMTAGRFATFEHDHAFTDRNDGTVLLQDEVRFSMQWGWLGDIIGQRLLVPHIRGLMQRRFERLKRIAEGEEWRRYLPNDAAVMMQNVVD